MNQTVISPNYKQLGALPFTPEMAEILDALNIDEASMPPKYIWRQFAANGCTILRQDDDHYLCYRPWARLSDHESTDGRGSSQLIGATRADYEAGCQETAAGEAVRRWLSFVRDSAADRSLRRWLALWGWRDPKASSTTQSTPMVI